jgi:hypothetical protein
MAAIARTIRASFCSLIISQRPEWLELLEGDRAQAGVQTVAAIGADWGNGGQQNMRHRNQSL